MLSEEIIQNVERMVNDKRYYYSQNRENQFATDCSWLIITAIKQAGIKTNATYTGNMCACLKETGKFTIMPFKITSAKRGDIFLKHIKDNNGHAVLYIGDNMILEACNKKYGLRKTQYYANNYQTIIRPIDNDIVFETIRKGSRGILVIIWQMFLNNYFGCRLEKDGVFGQKTHEATLNAQIKMGFIGNDVDGIVGEKTWRKAFTIMETNC